MRYPLGATVPRGNGINLTEWIIMDDIIAQQHDNGVHVDCDEDECSKSGTAERFHSHDYDGPLVCCDE